MKLAVDVMGYENKIEYAINACIDFVGKHKDVEIILVGDKNLIQSKLKSNNQISIVHANDVIYQNDNLKEVRNKKDSSMLVAIQLVKNKKADGVLSAGNSSIYVFLTYQQFGFIDGIKKIGFMPYIPTFKGNGFNMLDVGASIDCDGYDLYMFAIMAKTYIKCRNIENPRIGLLNIGVESHKGFPFHKEADEYLKVNKSLNYIGFVESKLLLEDTCDIVISDGYAGNICLKTLEGSIKSVFKHILKYYKKTPNWLAFPFVIGMLWNMKKKFDYKNNAGAFVLGLNNIAVKTHGSADYLQFFSSLKMLKESIDHNILVSIKKEVHDECQRMKK